MNNIKLINDNVKNIMDNIPDNAIDLIITDPPYKTTSRGNAGNSGGMLQEDINKKGQVFKHNNIDCTEYAKDLYRILKDTGHCYIMTNHVNLLHMLNTFTDLRTKEEKQNNIKPYGFHFIKSLIWDKGNKIMGTFYMSQFEYVLFFRKGKGVKINNCGTSDILSIPNKKMKDENNKNLHNTEKPVDLMKILIENSSKENEIVFDPFMGIGATGVVCKQIDRQFLGIEIDTEYFNIAEQRIKNTKKREDNNE